VHGGKWFVSRTSSSTSHTQSTHDRASQLINKSPRLLDFSLVNIPPLLIALHPSPLDPILQGRLRLIQISRPARRENIPCFRRVLFNDWTNASPLHIPPTPLLRKPKIHRPGSISFDPPIPKNYASLPFRQTTVVIVSPKPTKTSPSDPSPISPKDKTKVNPFRVVSRGVAKGGG